jgi:ABC-type transport system substrate-binding protein
MLSFIKDDLAKVGIRIVPEPVEFRTLVSHVREDHRYDAVLLGFSSAVPPDPGMSGNVYRSAGATHWWNALQSTPATPAEARIDSLFARNIGTLDAAERHRTTSEMARILNDEVFIVWLPSPVMKVPVRDAFGNVHPTPIPHRLLWNIDRVYRKPPHPGV